MFNVFPGMGVVGPVALAVEGSAGWDFLKVLRSFLLYPPAALQSLKTSQLKMFPSQGGPTISLYCPYYVSQENR